jgi:hypothetical protein
MAGRGLGGGWAGRTFSDSGNEPTFSPAEQPQHYPSPVLSPRCGVLPSAGNLPSRVLLLPSRVQRTEAEGPRTVRDAVDHQKTKSPRPLKSRARWKAPGALSSEENISPSGFTSQTLLSIRSPSLSLSSLGAGGGARPSAGNDAAV